ncbi:MAG: hypothetical protein HQM09_21030, partial [Candidatus Riflebacteria bacterium]|nr:hypothetical protein [Candidatus Riflebacteria bacterium]
DWNKDQHNACGGLGGATRPIAIIVVKKDGTLTIHRIQPEGVIAQGVQALVPVLQNLINKRFDMMKFRESKSENPSAPPTPGK